MNRSDFKIGTVFQCGDGTWRCTDVGTRVIVAIRIDKVSVGSTSPEKTRVLSGAEAVEEGWFNGPPYGVLESVFDEYDMEGCKPCEVGVA